MDTSKLEQATALRGTPIYASGTRVRLAAQVALDPACKVSDYIGATGIVRWMVASERGQPCEWCAVFWPHRAATSIWHADAIEEADKVYTTIPQPIISL